MKITDLSVRRYGDPATPAGQRGPEIAIVEVSTDAGISGIGFLTTGGATGELVLALLRRGLRNAVLGQNPLLTDEVWQRMMASLPRRGGRGLAAGAIAAVDVALWDIKGKLANAPVSDLLGRRRERVATYANAAHNLPPDKLAEKARDYVTAGHTALKIRGTRSFVTLAEATERVKWVREAIGPDVKLLVDVNGSWDVDTAIQQLKAWQRYDVYWLEEPVPPDDIPGYVRVRQRAGSTYIAGGEQHAGLIEFRQLIDQGAVDVVQPNVAMTGGITDWLRIYNYATACGVPVSPWNLQTVHIHMAAGLANVKWIEYFLPDNPLLEFQTRLFKGPLLREERTDEGVFILPPEAPGIGLALEEEFAERALIRE